MKTITVLDTLLGITAEMRVTEDKAEELAVHLKSKQYKAAGVAVARDRMVARLDVVMDHLQSAQAVIDEFVKSVGMEKSDDNS